MKTLREMMDAYERKLIESLLRKTGGNLTEAAGRAGMPVRTFWYRCDRLRIDKAAFRTQAA